MSYPKAVQVAAGMVRQAQYRGKHLTYTQAEDWAKTVMAEVLSPAQRTRLDARS